MRKSNKLWLLSALSFVLVVDAISVPDYVPTETIFLNCGGPTDPSHHSIDALGRHGSF